jgi:hypothetical protein
MQKIYLLLRNNRQTGPFSLDELKSHALCKDDLIWVEGRSAGWSFPYEIETLRHLFPIQEKQDVKAQTIHPPPASSSKVFVSLPLKDRRSQQEAPTPGIEDRAEAIRNRAFETQPTIETKYNRPLEEIEDNYTSWVFENRKKKPKISKKYLLVATIILAGSFSGWKLANFVYSEKKPVSVHIPLPVTKENVSINNQQHIPGEEPKKQQTPIVHNPTKELPATETTVVNKKINNIIVSTTSNEPRVKEEVMEVQPPKEVAGTIEQDNRKQGLKEKINNWLKGSKKENENEMGERSYVDISHKVDLRLIGEQDNWMMGIKGQKISLSNRSEQKLSAATVEILYYTEQNDLLDKKMVALENVSPGKSKTITIPDHKMADHVDVRLVSAKAAEE